YGVPLDARIRTYAAADIRAYVLNRILDIIDKVAYDEPLTANERLTFEFVEDTVKELERTVARAAYEEFKAWEANKCGYVPPAAPSFVTQPVTMPAAVTAWCAHKKPQVEA